MGRYRKIDPRMWCDETFRARTDEGKLVFILLLTHPDQTSLGAFRATPSALALMLRWSEKRFAKPFAELLAEGLIQYDSEGLVWLPNFLRYNAPENGNVVKSWVTFTAAMPPCPLLNRVLESAKPFAQGFGIPLREPFVEPFGNSQNPNPNPNPEPRYTKAQRTVSTDPYSEEFEAWWSHYPKKTGKRAAFEEWAKVCARVAPTVLLEAVIQFETSAKGLGDYCWDPRTWLHQGHWEDDPETWKEREHGRTTKPCGPGQRHPADAQRTAF